MPGWAIGLIVGAVALIIVIAIVAWWVSTYNKLIRLKQRVGNGWSQIEIQLKKRYDLIPNLVETVKGYAKHESETLNNITMWRSKAGNANTQQDVIEANNGLSSALSRLLVSVERYPELKANANFLQLQAELKDVESKIAYARQFYNDVVEKYNAQMEVFPSSLVASANKSKFASAEYFKAEESVYTAPKVSF